MDLVILDPADQTRIIARRRKLGHDRFDEVWDGVYLMSPLANNEHQEIATRLASCLVLTIDFPGLGKVFAGANVSDRATKWKQNYRCPDVLVFLNGTTARNKDTHWLGGPDFAVEVVSQYDRSRQKFDFYAKVTTRELLIVDRYPWALELYRLNEEGTYNLIGRSALDDPQILMSQVLPLSFQLQPGDERPTIAIAHFDGVQTWSA